MTGQTWTPGELERLEVADELEIAVRRDDGSLRPWVPIWVVCAGVRAYVRLRPSGTRPRG
jgi:hypothetical protein